MLIEVIKINTTDKIIEFIKNILEEDEGVALLQRNELAQKVGCVPSQINYVITKWFTKEQGFIVESRRGGGGYIKIIKVNMSNKNMFFHIINSIGDYLDEVSARIIIENIYNDNLISQKTAKLMLACMDDNNFKTLDEETKQKIRANLFKTMLINLI